MKLLNCLFLSLVLVGCAKEPTKDISPIAVPTVQSEKPEYLQATDITDEDLSKVEQSDLSKPVVSKKDEEAYFKVFDECINKYEPLIQSGEINNQEADLLSSNCIKEAGY